VKEARIASTLARPTWIHFACRNGKAAFDRSASLASWSSARDFGPVIENPQSSAVALRISTPLDGAWAWSQRV
jgi:hypothetical protein